MHVEAVVFEPPSIKPCFHLSVYPPSYPSVIICPSVDLPSDRSNTISPKYFQHLWSIIDLTIPTCRPEIVALSLALSLSGPCDQAEASGGLRKRKDAKVCLPRHFVSHASTFFQGRHLRDA